MYHSELLADVLAALQSAFGTIVGLVQTYWRGIALAAAGAAGGELLRLVLKSPLVLNFLTARRAHARLRSYFKAELSLLRSWPSLISPSPIDFATDYVALVLVEGNKNKTTSARTAVSIKEILESKRPIAIVSGPGCGKTTLLLHMQYELLRRRKRRLGLRVRRRSVPIFIRAKDVGSGEISIHHAIAERLNKNMPDDTAKKITSLGIRNGWFTVLIDGIDEIEFGIEKFLNEVRQFAATATNTHLILSSRPISFDLSTLTSADPRSFKEIAIAPLSLAKKQVLIEKYSPNQNVSDKVIVLITTQEFLSELSSVIINLILLIDTVTYSETLSHRADFYRHAAIVLLSTMPERKGAHLSYSTGDKLRLLEALSFEILVNKRSFSRHTIVNYVRPSGEHDEAVFSEIVSSSGMIRLTGLDRYDFPHRTFSEYFAARHMQSRGNALAQSDWQKALADRSSEVLAFLSNLVESVDTLVPLVLNLIRDPVVPLAVCLSECRAVSRSVQSCAEEIIWNYLKDSTDLLVQRSQARQVLAKIHKFPSLDECGGIYDRLLDQLSNPERYTPSPFSSIEAAQADAMKYLIHTRSQTIVPRLVSILTDANSENWTKFKAGELLAILAREDVIGDLDNSYRMNWDDDVRRFIVEALVRTRSPLAIPALTAALQDQDPTIRDLSIIGIKYIESRDFLEDATIVRQSAVEGKTIVPGIDLSPTEILEIALDRSSNYRLDGFFRLRQELPTDSAERLLTVALDWSENEYFRGEAVKLIGSQADASFAKCLTEVFSKFDPTDPTRGVGARGYAIEYLAYRKYYPALDLILASHLEGRSANERTKVFWSLSQLTNDIDVEELKPRTKAISELCRANEKEAYARLHHWRVRTEQNLVARCAVQN